ncbi:MULTISPECIES: hypothetical protein [Amycolatopsis]|uniref:hypothetical protein n=1 Tax=Amycolatopsis TaxID=1813 RepID=UPI001177E9C1|nr:MULTISPECIES: hypothetical protein [Amycolatopsis]
MSFPGVAPGRRPGWHGGRIVGAVLALLAAAAAVTGSFLALFLGELLFQGEAQLKLTVTGWDLSAEAVEPGIPTDTFGSPVRNGYLLAAAGLLLLVAAVLGLAAARRTAAPGRKLAAALATAIGAAFLLATTAGIVLQGVSLHESFRPTGAAEDNGEFTTGDSFGLGFWLVAGATLAAIAAAVLATTRGRRAPDLTTPRYGVPAPPGYQPGPQFPAPTRHWPTGEPYPSGQGMPPHAGFAPGPPQAPQPPGQPDLGRPPGGQAATGQPDQGWSPTAQAGPGADTSPEESPRPEQRPGADRPQL